jgi:hypothetical protein
MNNLNDLVFNPKTGLFENRNDPTAHLSPSELRRQKRKSDPMREQMKPRVNFFRRTGDKQPMDGELIVLSWNTDRAKFVRIDFPDGKRVELPPVGRCLFTMPPEICQIRLVAHNGRYHTQATIKIKPMPKIEKAIKKLFGL